MVRQLPTLPYYLKQIYTPWCLALMILIIVSGNIHMAQFLQ